MNHRWLAAAGIVGAAVLLRSSTAAASPSARPLGATSIRLMALPLEQLLRQPGLADFLTAVAYTESRFDTNAANSLGFRGLFQMNTNTSRVADAGGKPDDLFNPRWSIALVAWFFSRLRNYARPGQTIDWLAVRRGMAYPTLVDDVEEQDQRSREVRGRLEEGLRAVKLPQSFMRRAAFPAGYNWPGIAAALKAVGVGGVT